ncbi:zinc-ribbon domain-containing protein [Desulfovibrio mangrovi]|uniref:YIP1 family protein n=1 Tax=Desulfovibrio mangrovi TaxID=2976983 RepID=UPI00224741B5|nr:YIP1 family protein [Desulfovibrio mangrovi]UZP68929.1 zinc-ribbon domain-containing protein [Desulfovibrio mangrovi]
MKLVCPQCQYTKELDEAVIPAEMVYATCPQCRHRFRFRGEEPDFGLEASGPEDQPEPAGDDWAAGNLNAGAQKIGAGAQQSFAAGSPETSGEGGTAPSVDPAVAGIPWAYRHEVGWLSAFIATVRAVLVTPAEFFGRAGTEWRKAGVFPFYIICITFGLTVGQVWAWAITTFLSDVLSEQAITAFGGNFLGLGMALGMVTITAVISPLFLLVTAGIIHGCLKITGGARKGFGATAMVCGFGASTYVLYLVPFIGQFLGGLWGLFVLLVGLRHAHGVPMWRVVLAVVLPFIIILLLIVTAGMVNA